MDIIGGVFMYKAGLEGVVAAKTALSLVDGEMGLLVYRGHFAKELALEYTFEEIAYLLWYGALPNEKELEEIRTLFINNRVPAENVKEIIRSLPSDMDMMGVLRTVLSAVGTSEYQWPPTIEQTIKLTSLVPTIIAYRYRYLKNLDLIAPDPKLDHVANYLYMLKGEIPKQAHVKALTGYMILTMEHGMNASTFTARVISSTESDMVSAVVGAIGSMKGPLHGGAPSEVLKLLDEIGSKENAEQCLRKKLENGEKLMGFGHRVYKTKDPRGEALRVITSKVSADDKWFDLALYTEKIGRELLEEYKPGRRLYANVEFYAAAILRAIALPEELFTPTFTAARMVGWTAHVLEQSANNRIFRPSSEYTGEIPTI